jgi:hypothetical protein
MSEAEIIELHKKIMNGLLLAVQKLLEEKRKSDGVVAVYHNGKRQIIKARDINW